MGVFLLAKRQRDVASNGRAEALKIFQSVAALEPLISFGEKFSPVMGRHCSYIFFAEESAAPVSIGRRIFLLWHLHTN